MGTPITFGAASRSVLLRLEEVCHAVDARREANPLRGTTARHNSGAQLQGTPPPPLPTAAPFAAILAAFNLPKSVSILYATQPNTRLYNNSQPQMLKPLVPHSNSGP